MGAGLAKAAYAAAARAGVDHAPTRVFVFMALAPLDSDPTPAYFGGAATLAVDALGRPDDESGLRAVRRSIHALRAAKLLDRERRGRGNTVRFSLLDGLGEPLMGGRSASGQSEDERTLSVRSEPGWADTQRPVKSGWADAQRPVDNSMTGRSAPDDRTLSAGWADAQRPVEEEEEIEEGVARASAPAQTPARAREAPSPPSRYCSRHPNGTEQPCGPCREARLALEKHEHAEHKPAPRADRPRGACGHVLIDDRHCERGCTATQVIGEAA